MLVKKTPPFHFQKFTLRQSVNPQKVGTDSMLLGAWSSGSFRNILDIGTGTGILALMLAQQNPNSKVIAIEPDAFSVEEANINFSESAFSKQIQTVNSSLQDYKSEIKFDLIISNPPYFENSTLSENDSKNKARHTLDLSIDDLYTFTAALLSEDGHLNLIFPYDLEAVHFSSAAEQNLFPKKILRTQKESGEFKRTLVSYSRHIQKTEEAEMIVKYADNSYSAAYIEMTKAFYGTDLSKKGGNSNRS